MSELPCVLWLPERESQERMTKKFLRCFRWLVRLQVFTTCHEQVAIPQQPYRNERSIVYLFIHSKGQINALGDLIDDPFRDENLNSDLRIPLLERNHNWCEQRIRDTWRSRDPQGSGDV